MKLDRLGRNLRHPVNSVHDLTPRGTVLNALTGQGAAIDITTVYDKLVFGIFATLAAPAPAATKGATIEITPAEIQLAGASMGKPGTNRHRLHKGPGTPATTSTGAHHRQRTSRRRPPHKPRR